MFGDAPGLFGVFPVLSMLAVASAVFAAIILVWYLLRKPPLTGIVKLVLLMGIGVFPIGTALTGNLAGYQRTMDRDFCGSCHVMEPFSAAALDPDNTDLPALHTRNDLFGEQSCYECHADYGMFGTIATKWGGMHHVWEYYVNYSDMPVEEALPRIEVYDPYPNANCMHCHSTQTPGFLEAADHRSSLRAIRAGAESCVSAGCHGPAHPFAGPDSREEARAEAAEAREGKDPDPPPAAEDGETVEAEGATEAEGEVTP